MNPTEQFLLEHPGSTLDELIALFLSETGRRLTRKQVLRDLERLGDRVREASGAYWLIESEPLSAPASMIERSGDEHNSPQTPTQGHGPEHVAARAIVFDLETVVRQITEPPYLERHIYQIGAVRLSRDDAWQGSDERTFSRYVTLPAPFEDLLTSGAVKAKYTEAKQDPEFVLDAFLDYCQGATHLVAYNGTGLDFGVLRALLVKYGRALPAGIRFVDGLYLAHALWPTPPGQHRLADILRRIGEDVGDLSWHDALDDSRMLRILVRAGRKVVDSWSSELRELVRSATTGSDPWDLLFALLEGLVVRRPHDDAAVREVMSAEITARKMRPLRDSERVRAEARPEARDTADGPPPTIRPGAPLALPTGLLDPTGRVDVFALANAGREGKADRRKSQDEMVAWMRERVAAHRSALVEAPTGTGKSYAMLAVGLDWLAADPRRKVVISTYTKALQAQLAEDLEKIDKVVPGLLGLTDVVKGTGNRLSLRALLIALADLCAATPRRGRGRADYTNEPRFRDLVVYLALRLLAESSTLQEWLAHSVDSVDIPPFFDEYVRMSVGGKALSIYLHYLSQAQAGEIDARGSAELAAYTSTVNQALDEHRLIIANHALLLAHPDAFTEIAEETLLMVDEAHALENAATQALSAVASTPDVQQLDHDIREWVSDIPVSERGQAHRDLLHVVDDLADFLEHDALELGAGRAFATLGNDALRSTAMSARRVIVASRFLGPLAASDMGAIKDGLRGLSHEVGRVADRFRDVPEPPDLFDRDRWSALGSRIRELSRALATVAGDLFDLDRGQLAPDVIAADAAAADVEEASDGASETVQLPLLADVASAVAGSDGQAAEAPAARRPARRDKGPSNQVVWLEEMPSERPVTLARDLRFRAWSSPIELGRDPSYRDFRDGFGLVFYISATLRVGRDMATAFDFTRDRLALPAERIDARALGSPFDMSKQARLIVFDDFPSWAEQEVAATKTVAHQLAGYAEIMVRGNANGAMTVTTSRAVASGIADALLRLPASQRLVSAPILGTRRAVEEFRESGGLLVGTKGLWQGVDIAEHERLRLLWINKLPFPSFEDPLIKTRRALVVERATEEGSGDPDGEGNARYYLPLAAIDLRQAVGRLVRTKDHKGAVIISDRKLAGPTRLRRQYRDIFLGSLDEGLLVADPETAEPTGGNIMAMAEGWRRILRFYAAEKLLPDDQDLAALTTDEALEELTQLPELLAVRRLRLSREEEARLRVEGRLADELVARGAAIGGYLNLQAGPVTLKPEQEQALRAIAEGKDLLAVLPTGFGKSFVFQLPALALDGVTIVVSPLVSLMTDQALELNRSIAGAVRALVAPMRESNSRTGKVEVQQQVEGTHEHGIRLVYLSPERLCSVQFQNWIRTGIERGTVRRIAIDEAHTFVTWGDDFRPSFRRAERFLRTMKAAHPELTLMALTATATRSVRNGLRRSIFELPDEPAVGAPQDPPSFAFVTANPVRTNLALWPRRLGAGAGGPIGVANTVLSVARKLDRHAILYCLTVKETVRVHNMLALALGEDRVRLYHGRLPDAQKAATANAFKSAEHYDPAHPEDFKPLIVVATSAFGLGINRDDIRTVFCVSPPTDLAALYQQVGRAGRDHAPAAGLMLSTDKAFNVLRFMTRRERNQARLARITSHLLGRRVPWVDTEALARAVALVEKGKDPDSPELLDGRFVEEVHVQVVRVLAELAAVGVLDDLGDFPQHVRLLPGIENPDTAAYRELVDAIWANSDDPAHQELTILHARLAEAGFGDELPDPGTLWALLLTLHAEGFLEVSQWGNKGTVSGVRLTGASLPEDFFGRFDARQAILDAEINSLTQFFTDPACVNARFASYFGATVPAECCGDSSVRCAAHWNGLEGSADAEPPLFEAFYRPRASFAGQADFRRRELRDLPSLIEGLLRFQRKGLAFNLVYTVLCGREVYWNAKRERKRLWPALIENRFFGKLPTLKRPELDAALHALEAGGRIVLLEKFWRHVAAIEADQEDAERRARRALEAAARAARPTGVIPIGMGL